jgi:hypothetical protein
LPTSDVLMKDSENLIVSSKLTIPVPKLATILFVSSSGVIVPRSNVDAAAGRPAGPITIALANSNATSRFIGSILLPVRERRLKAGPPTSTTACATTIIEKRAGRCLRPKFFYDIEGRWSPDTRNNRAALLPEHASQRVSRGNGNLAPGSALIRRRSERMLTAVTKLCHVAPGPVGSVCQMRYRP